jgi:two-component system sensor histidine kinase BarA
VISYRALKKLIGESSLERKCRFLFGFALLFLITASFWLYASRTRRLIEYQQLLRAKDMVPQVLPLVHYPKLITAAVSSEEPASLKSQDEAQAKNNGEEGIDESTSDSNHRSSAQRIIASTKRCALQQNPERTPRNFR